MLKNLKTVHRIAKTNMKLELEKTNKKYNKKAYRSLYNIGDKLWYLIPVRKSKLDPYYEGPFNITQKY